MKNPLFITVIAFFLVFGVIGSKKLEASRYSGSTKSFSMDIVYDGNHHKIENKVIEEAGHLFISLPDLENIAMLKVEQHGDEITINHGGEKLVYKDAIVQNENVKANEIQKFHRKKDLIYIPDRHIEKFLGIKIDFFMHEKTGTISLMSAAEQQKATYGRSIGSTIFVHKNEFPLAKYEPRNGIYLGGYVLQDEAIGSSMYTFNELANKRHASYFMYVGYGKPFPTEWVQEVIQAGGFPHIAWEPNDGLEMVQNDEYLRAFARAAGSVDAPILLRYASEMNGTWTAYSGKSDLYIEKWRLVHDVMKEEAPNVMMLWNVFTMPENTIADFYPGDAYVDYVGVNVYNVMYHNDELSNRADFEDPLALLDYVYNTYSARKPIAIGEFGATNYSVTDGMHHVDFAIEKIKRMYTYLPKLYPRVKFIYYFDVNNLINAPEGRKINNYAITENERITYAYRESVGTNQYLSGIDSEPFYDESFSYRDFFFRYRGTLFVDAGFVRDYLQLEVRNTNDEEYEVSDGQQRVIVKSEKLTIDKAAFFEKREINGIPIHEILQSFQLHHEYDDNGDLHISM